MPSRHQRSISRQVVRSELEDIDLQNQDDLVFMACITAAAFVARADGWVDPAERDRLVDWMAEIRLLDSFAASDVTDMFAFRLRQFDQPGGAADAVETLGRSAGIPKAHLVVAAAELVAQADGRVQPSEARAIGLIRRTVFPLQAGSAPGPANRI